MATVELSQPIHPLINNVPSAPTPTETSNEKTIDPREHDLTCTFHATQTRAPWQVVGVENVGGKAYGKQLDFTTSIAST
jgi:hypothetical protein